MSAGTCARIPRADRYVTITALIERGHNQTQIARLLGVSRKLVSDILNDPSGVRARARKDKRTGTCIDCGGTTYNSGSPPFPKRCQRCRVEYEHANRHWTPELVIQRIQEWAAANGVHPSATDWLTGPRRFERDPDGPPGRRLWPTVTVCQEFFGSWANAVRAAGFEPKPPFMLTEQWKSMKYGARIWDEAKIVAAILDWNLEHGRPPSAEEWHDHTPEGIPTSHTCRRYFGTFADAIRAAGLTPRAETYREHVRLHGSPLRGRTFPNRRKPRTPKPKPNYCPKGHRRPRGAKTCQTCIRIAPSLAPTEGLL